MDQDDKLWNIEMNNKFQLSQEGLTGSEEKADRTKITMSNIDGRKILDYSVGRGFMIGISECTDTLRLRKKTKSEPHDLGLKPARSSSKNKKTSPSKHSEPDLEQVLDGIGKFEGRVDGWMKKNAKLEKDYSDLKKRLEEEGAWKENRRKETDPKDDRQVTLETRPHTSSSNPRKYKDELLSTLKESIHSNQEDFSRKASLPPPNVQQGHFGENFKTLQRQCNKCDELAKKLREEREDREARDREDEAELRKLTEEFKKEMNALVEENRRLKDEVDRSTRREGDLMREFERVKADQERLEQSELKQTSSHKKLIDELDKVKDKLSDAQREAARLKDDLNVKASKLYTAETDTVVLKSRLEQLEAELQQAKRKEEDMQKYQQILKQQLDTTFQQSLDPVPTFGLNSANNRQLTFNPKDQRPSEEPPSRHTKSSRFYQDDFIDMKEYKQSTRSSGDRSRSQNSRSTDKPLKVTSLKEPYPPYSHNQQLPPRFHSSIPPHLIDDFAKSSKILLNVFNDASEMTGDSGLCGDRDEIKVLEDRVHLLELKNSLNT
jgi:regulator of replication initiation timing